MDDEEAPVQLDVGHVEVTAAAPPVSWDALAVLWLPDPEQRHGWREFYVKRPADAKPGGKIGF